MTKIVNYPYLSCFSPCFPEMVNIARSLTASNGREVCGVVGGRLGQIFEYRFVDNIHPDSSTYQMDPIAMSKALDELDSLDCELIALFHTHPGDSSIPSVMDLQNKALDIPMIIVSQKDIKAWRFKDDLTFDEVKLAIHTPAPRISVGPIKALNTDGLRITLEVSGKVFEELPEILKSFFGNRNGPNFEQRISDVMRILQLLTTIGRPLREHDDPDALLGELTANPRLREQLQVMMDNQINSHPLITSAINPNRPITNPGALSPLSTPFPPEPPRPPPHTHRYRQVSKDAEGRNIYECIVEHCDKSLTIDGDLEIPKGNLEVIPAQYTEKEGELHGEPSKG